MLQPDTVLFSFMSEIGLKNFMRRSSISAFHRLRVFEPWPDENPNATMRPAGASRSKFFAAKSSSSDAMGSRPRTARDYEGGITAASRTGLAEIMRTLGAYRNALVLIGG